jgi:hypothetical protein
MVEQVDGRFTASVAVSACQLRADGATAQEAVDSLRAELIKRVKHGELVPLEIGSEGVLALAGKYKDDPGWQEMWDEIATEAYRYRDELKAREFPE